MAKTHDEAKDLRLVSRIARVNYFDKTIQAPRTSVIGNKTWGRIDYLTRYCGWHFFWNNEVKVAHIPFTGDVDNLKPRKKESKRTIKDNNNPTSRKRR